MALALKKELERKEKRALAPYAVLSSESRGREFSEKEDPTRTEFQRDRDRIIHSKAFRRLSGKTQVFVATYGDHFRDRLSHTLEVAQIARDIARNLRVNEDLCEAIALAHDLGHTPFGHAGQDTLNEIMQKFGLDFEHNMQSKRIVEVLERQFPNFEGLNLTYEVRQGLAKHQTVYDQRGEKITGKTLEAQIVDIADEIAYHNHDIDDGLRSGIFTMRHMSNLRIFRRARTAVEKKYGANASRMNAMVLRHRIVSQIVSMMIADVLATTARNITRNRVQSANDVTGQPRNLVRFSLTFIKDVKELRAFLWHKLYQSSRVLKHTRRGQRIIKALFEKLYKNPKLMPRHFWKKIGADSLTVVVKDYIAGCTDAYAELSLRGGH